MRQQAEKMSQTEIRKVAYRYVVAVLEGRLPNGCGALSPEVTEEVVRFTETVAAAGQVPPIVVVPDVPLAEQPQLTKPTIQKLATTKVNGSNGAH